MKPKQIMLIAGEASGDLLAAELVCALRPQIAERERSYTPDLQPLHTGLEPRFFGAGGPRMAAAGVKLAVDMMAHSVIGLVSPQGYFKFRRLFHRLYRLALERQPDVIVCVDFSVFNRRFAQAVRRHVRGRRDWFHDWQPKIIQYVSPQVWASREGRAYKVAKVYDLLLSIFPFEKEWYARRIPRFPVRFVGHPVFDRYPVRPVPAAKSATHREIVLLPGSRPEEISRHVPLMLGALAQIRKAALPVHARMVLPNEALAQQARGLVPAAEVEIQAGDLPEALAAADLAISKTGTITMECAFFGVPTVTLYKTSALNYQLGKRLVKVKTLTMPNLLANEMVFPEFIQNAATARNIAAAALELLRNEGRRREVKKKLAEIIGSLGGPGGGRRAAAAILDLIDPAGPSSHR